MAWLSRAQKFSGRLGDATVTAIKAFQKANRMPETGAFTPDLAKKVYEVAGKEEPPVGHLFVRRNFKPVFDTPVVIRDPENVLGMHVFTAIFASDDLNARWMAISLEGDDALSALDRIEIPNDIRQSIEDKLTPGSSLIISDEGKDSAIIQRGRFHRIGQEHTRFGGGTPKPKAKRVTVARPKAKIRQKMETYRPSLRQSTISGVLINPGGHFSVGVGAGSIWIEQATHYYSLRRSVVGNHFSSALWAEHQVW